MFPLYLGPLTSPRSLPQINEFNAANFEVHRLVTAAMKEKCVDISLAVEMLYLATVPDAYDIAVIITGDKDFMPAMVKTRMTGKRVSLCSIRNSCNRDLIKPEQAVRDYDVIWLDEYLDELVVPKLSQKSDALDARLNAIIFKFIKESTGSSGSGSASISSRDLGRLLQSTCTAYPIITYSNHPVNIQHTLSISTHPLIILPLLSSLVLSCPLLSSLVLSCPLSSHVSYPRPLSYPPPSPSSPPPNVPSDITTRSLSCDPALDGSNALILLKDKYHSVRTYLEKQHR